MVRRRTVLATVGTAAIGSFAGCAGDDCSPSAPDTDPPSGWPQPGLDAAKTGRATDSGPAAEPEPVEWELWEYPPDEQTGSGTPPVVADGRAFVATGRPNWRVEDPPGRLYALERTSDAPVWTASLPDSVGGGPIVAGDAVVVTTVGGDVVAFDRESGDELWTASAPRALGAPTVAGDHLYVGDDSGRLVIVDLAAERRCGRRSPLSLGEGFLGTDRTTVTAPAVDGSTAYLALDVRDVSDYEERTVKIVALDLETGDVEWRYEARAHGRIRSPAVVDGVVYAPIGNALHAIDAADGTREWRFATGYEGTSRPAVADGTVYVSAKNVYALDAATGTERWRLVNRAELDGFTDRNPRQDAPVVTADRVYVGLGALDAATGDPLWGEFGEHAESEYFGYDDQIGNVAHEGAAVAGGAMVATVSSGRVVWFE
ncbi:outer membrane protein assembly factor BamB family protein [Halosimplex sp. J119]